MEIKDKALQDRFLGEVKKLSLKFPVADIAKATGIGEPTVSTYLNSKRAVSRPFLRKFCEVYKLDYAFVTSGKQSIVSGEGKRDITDRDLYAMFLTITAAQTEILKNIEMNMARQDSQAMIEKQIKSLDAKTEEMQANLLRTVVGVERISIVQDRSQIELLDHFAQLKSGIADPLEGESKKTHQIDGDGHKRDKKA